MTSPVLFLVNGGLAICGMSAQVDDDCVQNVLRAMRHSQGQNPHAARGNSRCAAAEFGGFSANFKTGFRKCRRAGAFEAASALSMSTKMCARVGTARIVAGRVACAVAA